MIKTGQDADDADFVIETTAGEALSARDACYISSSDGKAYKCDADDTTKIGFIGFAQEAASTNAAVSLIHTGLATGFSALTIGAQYYISGTAGSVTATAPTNKKIVGVAVSATVIKIAEYPTVRISTFTSSGTWTKLPGLKWARIRVQAPGGGGAGIDDTTGVARSGGGAGEYREGIKLAQELSATETVTIGSVGTGGTNTDGTSGGTTSFGSHISCVGGGGGSGTSSPGAGGSGGSGGDFAISGGSGFGAVSQFSTDDGYGGAGGAAHLGAGGRPNTNDNGGAGAGYGGGGAGAADTSGAGSGKVGGNGGPAIIIVEEHY